MRKFLIWGALLLSFITAPLAYAEINPDDPLTKGMFQSKFYSDKPWFAMEENGFVVGYGLYNDHKGKPVIFSKNYTNYIIGGTFYIKPDCTDDSYDLCVIGDSADDYENAWFYNKTLIIQTLSSFRIFTHNGSRYTASQNYLYDYASASKMGLYEIDDGSYNTPYVLFGVCYGGGYVCDYIVPLPDGNNLRVRPDWRDESFLDSAGTLLSNDVGLIRTFNNNRSDNTVLAGKKFSADPNIQDGKENNCLYDHQYKNIYNYVPYNFTSLSDYVPSYTPNNVQHGGKNKGGDIHFYTTLSGYSSFSGSILNILNETPIEVESRKPIKKYELFGFGFGENINIETGGYSDRYTKMSFRTQSGTVFNYFKLNGEWLTTNTELNDFVVEIYGLQNNKIISLGFADFNEIIQLPDYTRSVNLYFKDKSKFRIKDLKIGQASVCTQDETGEYTPSVNEQVIVSDPTTPPPNTDYYIKRSDWGVDSTPNIQEKAGDNVFFPGDGTQSENLTKNPDACKAAGGNFSENFGCVHGIFMTWITGIHDGVTNIKKLFVALLEIGNTQEKKDFFSFSLKNYLFPQTHAADGDLSKAVVGNWKRVSESENSQGKMLRFGFRGIMLCLIMATLINGFRS